MQLRNGSAHAPPKHLGTRSQVAGRRAAGWGLRDGVVLKSRTARGYYM